MLELTDWSEIFTEVTVHQDKFFGKDFRKFLSTALLFVLEFSC
jgi:hypothetical protein